MKNTIVLLAFLLLSTTFFGQDKEDKHEQIKALKTAFITTELSLTSQESEKFWPVYNAFETKQNELRLKKMKFYQTKLENELDKISEKEANNLLKQSESIEEALYNNRKNLYSDLKSVLSAVKILKLKSAEENFNKKLLKKYRGKKNN
jgi:hypothetical protein